MLKVLLVYESLETPSTTVRALQFRDCFDADGEIEATFVGRTSERMNNVMKRWPYRPSVRRPAESLERSIIARRENRIVQMASNCDVVMMMTVPSWPLHQRLVELQRPKVITDLIDALWLPCFQSQGWSRIHEMLSSSDAVICENEFTAKYTRDHCSKVSIVPDAPQLEVFDQFRTQHRPLTDECRIGWVGGKYTADALYKIFEPLEQLFARHPKVHLRLLGADPDRLPRFEKVRFSVLPTYDQHAMVTEALKMDIGIFPMFNVDESLYRGTLKTRVYMSAGAAVVGQRLGENETLIDHGTNGLLAGTDDEWLEGLGQLVTNAPRRKQLADSALDLMRREYSKQQCFNRLKQIIMSC